MSSPAETSTISPSRNFELGTFSVWSLSRMRLATVSDRALRSVHRSCRDWLSPLALKSLYIRSHLLLMPLHILLPHLLRKSLKRTVTQKAPVVTAFDP